MHNRSSKPKTDEVLSAFDTIQQIIEQTESPESAPPPQKNAAAVSLGRLGGLKGGHARAKALSPKKRSEIARRAAGARWANKTTK